ncbi:ComF family protein [Sporolactobacillus terrae]|uniref:ComF family protein n=1 Tax=Sporolactobacillus terrae TaxID=269673 RepID=A0A410D762_9BACL|nr:phosphoribosyltransferase family protein [Sporolactobacillus terrae]QAA21936.1 ComF family protein [Sporolactobacillus terrae]QAA24909.1 ComF family protein [Sporolactobacillus terrae]BBN98212.1 ComF operon protein 3 [Sporolactobacillus terrae]
MERCLFCGEMRGDPLSFHNLFSPDYAPGFCLSCREQLIPIDARHCCCLCGRDLSRLNRDRVVENRCSDCVKWARSGRNGLYVSNRAIYHYNPFLKEMINQFKFRGDVRLADGFAVELKRAYRHCEREQSGIFKRKPSFLLVPVPLSSERLLERGFNQADVLARQIGAPIVQALVRVRDEAKQSKKSRAERMRLRATPFRLNEKAAVRLSGHKILLIDDIYTTGATMRLASEALAAARPHSIRSLTLIHG